MSDTPPKPPGFENDLSDFGPVIWDSMARVPVAWGFEILNQLGPERFNELKQHGTPHCVIGQWYFVTRQMTRKDAEETYGEISNETFGPRGGWRSITFGSTTFTSKLLRPLPCGSCNAKPPSICHEACEMNTYPSSFNYLVEKK